MDRVAGTPGVAGMLCVSLLSHMEGVVHGMLDAVTEVPVWVTKE